MIESRAVVPAGDLNRLRQINEHAVLDAILAAGELRLSELAESTGLTRASVAEMVRGLQAKGWVVEEAPHVHGRGRPAHRYRFRPEAGYVVGVDIGAYTVRAAVADLAGRVLAQADDLLTAATPRKRRLAAVVQAVTGCLAEAQLTAEDVWVCTVGTTGRLDANGKVVSSTAIPDWIGTDLVAELAPVLPGRILVENDVPLATLAEQRLGAARDVRHVIVLQTGRRLGLGFVLNGRLYRGARNAAGDVSPLSALSADHAIDHLDLCTVPRRTDNHVQDVLHAAREGDPAALRALRRYTHVIGGVAATAVSLVDPEVLVITGMLSSFADLVLPALLDEINARCDRVPEVRMSSFGSDAVTLGGVCHGLNYAIDTLLARRDGVPELRRPN